jgi:hypothetical protein
MNELFWTKYKQKLNQEFGVRTKEFYTDYFQSYVYGKHAMYLILEKHLENWDKVSIIQAIDNMFQLHDFIDDWKKLETPEFINWFIELGGEVNEAPKEDIKIESKYINYKLYMKKHYNKKIDYETFLKHRTNKYKSWNKFVYSLKKECWICGRSGHSPFWLDHYVGWTCKFEEECDDGEFEYNE